MRRKKIYISGPMSGYEFKNKPAFDRAERWLLSKGYQNIVNPTAKPSEIFDHEATRDEYLAYMREDVFEILFNVPGIPPELKRRMIKHGGVDEVWTLKNWWKSKGATFEVAIAEFFELGIKYFVKEILNDNRGKTERARSINKAI